MTETMVECNGLNGPFYPIPKWLAKADLPAGAKFIYAYLLYCILTHTDVPPLAQIAEEIGTAKAVAVRNLQVLREAGLVQTERTGAAHVRTVYHLYEPAHGAER